MLAAMRRLLREEQSSLSISQTPPQAQTQQPEKDNTRKMNRAVVESVSSPLSESLKKNECCEIKPKTNTMPDLPEASKIDSRCQPPRSIVTEKRSQRQVPEVKSVRLASNQRKSTFTQKSQRRPQRSHLCGEDNKPTVSNIYSEVLQQHLKRDASKKSGSKWNQTRLTQPQAVSSSTSRERCVSDENQMSRVQNRRSANEGIVAENSSPEQPYPREHRVNIADPILKTSRLPRSRLSPSIMILDDSIPRVKFASTSFSAETPDNDISSVIDCIHTIAHNKQKGRVISDVSEKEHPEVQRFLCLDSPDQQKKKRHPLLSVCDANQLQPTYMEPILPSSAPRPLPLLEFFGGISFYPERNVARTGPMQPRLIVTPKDGGVVDLSPRRLSTPPTILFRYR